MRFLYSTGVRFYGFGIFIASAFNVKAREWRKGRANWRSQLPTISDQQVYWFHCASLGEFDQGIPVMNELKRKIPEAYILVSFFSPSGYKYYHKRNHPADHVCNLPLDTPSNARFFINHIQAKQAYFIKYEFWGNMILEAKSMGCEIFNVCGHFRSNQRFFRWHGGFFRRILNQFDHFYVQSEQSSKLLQSIDIKNVSVVGDTRYDRVLENKDQLQGNLVIENFQKDERMFIVGSSWPADESILMPVINERAGKTLIAPHNVDENHIQGIESKVQKKHQRFTSFEADLASELLILDTIGHLSSAYSYGSIAYVGGGFSGNLHNILEPAVFGLPVIFGPKHYRFPEAQIFINEGFGFSVNSEEELRSILDKIESDYARISQLARQYVESNRGAAKRIIDSITSN